MRAKELKKYKILSAFGNYKQGEFVEFYDAKDDDYVASLLKNRQNRSGANQIGSRG